LWPVQMASITLFLHSMLAFNCPVQMALITLFLHSILTFLYINKK